MQKNIFQKERKKGIRYWESKETECIIKSSVNFKRVLKLEEKNN